MRIYFKMKNKMAEDLVLSDNTGQVLVRSWVPQSCYASWRKKKKTVLETTNGGILCLPWWEYTYGH